MRRWWAWRLQEKIDLLSEAVRAICKAYTVCRGSCSYVENFMITEFDIESKELSTVDWLHGLKEQKNEP